MTDVATLALKVDSRQVKTATGDVRDLGSQSERAGKQVTGAAGTMAAGFKKTHVAIAAAAAGAAAMAAALGGTIRTIREFDSSMSQVAAITRATSGELAAMRDVAKDLGRTTEFTAAQAADGLKFLGMAGFEASESIAAIPAVLDLATASAMDLGSAADIASNVLSGFGLAAQEAASVADVLAAASSRANTTVSQLGGAMSTVAPIAAALEIDVADTAAAISAMSDAGIQGERAGTALRGVLASLAGPTKQATDALAGYGLTAEQVDPATQSLADIFGLLRERGLSTADAMAVFGREAASGALVLVEASDRVETFADDLRNAEGAASDTATIMRDNLAGDANAALSAIQGLAIAIGEVGLTSIIRGALSVVTEFARRITSLTESVSGFFTAHDPIEASVMAAAEAMNQEARQALQLSTRLLEMGEVSYDVLGAKIALVETTLRGIEASRQEAVALGKTSEAYLEASQTADQAREVIATFQNMMAQGIAVSPENLASYSDWIGKLQAAVAVQERIVEEAGEVGPEYEQAVAELDILKAYLADANGDTVRLGENTEDVTDSANAAATAAGKLASQLSVAASAALRVAQGLAAAPAGIQGFQDRAAQLTAQIDAIDAGYDQITAGAAGYRKELEQQYGLADAANEAEDAYISALIERQVREYENVERLNEAYNDKVTALNSVGSAGGSAGKSVAKGMKEAEKEAEKLADQIERLEFEANPIKKYNAELAKLNEIKANSNLTDGAYQNAVQDLNDELASQLPLVDDVAQAWGDWLSRGFQDFKSFADDILSSFTSLLSQMIATAARNRILFSLGIGGSVAGSAASAGGLLGGGGGGGGILGQLGGLGGGLLGTLGSTAAGTVGTGLIGGAGNALGIGLSSFNPLAIGANAAMAGGGIAATIGAALPVIGGVALAVSALKKAFSRRYYGSGIRGSLGADGADVQAFDFYKGGFFKSDRTVYKPLQEEMQTVLDDTVGGLTTSIKGMAETLGLASDAADDFNLDQFTIWTNDKSEQEIQEALTAEIDKLAAGMADLILTTDEYTRAGETSFDTLQRLSTSLTGVNDVLDLLGRDLLDLSLAGADAASSFVDLFGSIENLNASATAYYQSFYSEQERFERAFSDLEKTFEGMNLTLPKNRAEYRALIEAQDMATEAGRRMTAALLKMAPAFDSVMTAAANSVKNQITAAQQNVSAMQTEIGVQEQIIQEAQRAREGALRSVEQAGRAVEQARGQVAQAENQLAQARKAQAQFAAQDAADAAAARLDAAQDRLSALQDQRDDLLSDMESSFEDAMGIAERLAKTARNVMSVNEDIAEIQRVAALRQLRVMLETGRIDAERLDRLTDSATNFGDTFTSQVDLLRAQAQTAQTISALSELQEDLAEQDRQTQLAQLSALEAQLANAQDTIDAIEDQTAAQEAAARAAEARGLAAEARSAASAVSAAEANLRASERAAADAALQAQLTIEAADKAEAAAMEEIARLEQAISVEETQISLLQKQLNVLEQLLSSSNAAAAAAKAQAQAAKAQAAAQAQAAAAAAATPTMTASEQAVESIYQNTFGRSADQSGLNNYAPMLANNSITAAAIEQQLRNSAEGIALGLGTQAQGSRTQSDAYDEIAATIKPPANMTKTENDPFAFPGFADGGTHAGGWRMVGERGPELEYTGPSRIHSSRQSEQMLRDPELRKEMVKLNEYVRELVKINNKQERRLREIELQGIEA